MTVNFYIGNTIDDGDIVGSGEFVEGTVTLCTEFDLPDGQIDYIRCFFPTTPGAAPVARVFNAASASLMNQAFDTVVDEAWNSATPGSPIIVSAGLYRVGAAVTRYRAKGGFFSGGPITRNGITASRSMFDSGNTAPTQASTATYYMDIGFTPSGGGGMAQLLGLTQPF